MINNQIIQNIDDLDRQIMQMRALGFHQDEIARKLQMSQSAISQRIEKIRNQTQGISDTEKLFWTLLVGAGAIYLLSKIFNERR